MGGNSGTDVGCTHFRVQRTLTQSAHDESDRIRNELAFARSTIQCQQEEIRRLNEAGTNPLRHAAEDMIAKIATDEEGEGYGMIDLAIELLGGLDDVYHADFLGPALCQTLGLPSDPWPGLMREDISKMTEGRTREARNKGLWETGFGEALFMTKLRAARHREWLEHRTIRRTHIRRL